MIVLEKMSSNVQTQINDLNAAVQALDSSLTQITGNTMSNYNQLSRIVSQQANIYNTVYYGTGNMSTGFLSIGANCNISGNLVIGSGNIVSSGNLVMSSGNIVCNRLSIPTSTNLISPFTMDYYTTSTVASLGSAQYGNVSIPFGKTYNSILGIWPTCYSTQNGVGIATAINTITTTSCVLEYYNSRGSTANNFSFKILVLGT